MHTCLNLHTSWSGQQSSHSHHSEYGCLPMPTLPNSQVWIPPDCCWKGYVAMEAPSVLWQQRPAQQSCRHSQTDLREALCGAQFSSQGITQEWVLSSNIGPVLSFLITFQSLTIYNYKQNAFSESLSPTGFDLFRMLVIDLLHEFELGVWKAIFAHLLRLLDSLKPSMVHELDRWWGSLKWLCDFILGWHHI